MSKKEKINKCIDAIKRNINEIKDENAKKEAEAAVFFLSRVIGGKPGIAVSCPQTPIID